MQYALLSLAALLLGVDFALNKVYQKIYGATPKSSFLFNSLLGLVTFIIYFIAKGCKPELTLYSCCLAGLTSLLMMSYNVIGFKILKMSGSIAVYTLYLMTGGMILPYLWGCIFLNEPLSILRLLGLIVIVTGVIISNSDGRHTSIKQLVMCIAVFVLNGCVSIISKIHQIETVHPTVGTPDFVMLGGIFKFLFAGMLFLLCKNGVDAQKPISMKSAVIIITASAIVGSSSYALQLFGAKEVPATVLYPFITGGGIVFSALADILVFKQRPSKKLIASILLCFMGTLMFL